MDNNKPAASIDRIVIDEDLSPPQWQIEMTPTGITLICCEAMRAEATARFPAADVRTIRGYFLALMYGVQQ